MNEKQASDSYFSSIMFNKECLLLLCVFKMCYLFYIIIDNYHYIHSQVTLIDTPVQLLINANI